MMSTGKGRAMPCSGRSQVADDDDELCFEFVTSILKVLLLALNLY